jgi:hypothetical protein
MTIVVDKEFFLSEDVIKSRWDENSTENQEIETLETGTIFPACLECGKWTTNGEQITYHTEYKQSVANMVFSLSADDEKRTLILKSHATTLEKVSFERARQAPENRPSEHMPVP